MNSLIYCIAGLFAVGVMCATVLTFAPGDHTTTITLIGAMVMTGAGFLIQHFNATAVQHKLDVNTALTVQGNKEARKAATEAVSTAAAVTQGVVAELKETVNGRMEELAAAKYAEGVLAGQSTAKELQKQLDLQVEGMKTLRESLKMLKCQQEQAAAAAEAKETQEKTALEMAKIATSAATEAVKTAADAGTQVAEKVLDAAEHTAALLTHKDTKDVTP